MAAQWNKPLAGFSLDLNQDYDQCRQLPLQDRQAFSSSSSPSSRSFDDHGGSYYRESPLFRRQQADLARDRDRSRNHWTAENESESEFSPAVLKKEETRTQKRIRKMKNDDQSSGLESSCSATIRVCSDCNTTKTPLWRSGPRGPKTLCNACGIRQRKARRAMAAAAMAVTEQTKMAQKKEKKRRKVFKTSNNGGTSLCFEDIAVKLRKNSAFHRVFPQDEKEAAILLMALSYGLVHG